MGGSAKKFVLRVMESQNQFWGLLAKKLTKEASPEELQELHSLMLNNPELQHRAEILTEMWQQQKPSQSSDNETAYLRYMMKYKNEFFDGEEEIATTTTDHDESLFDENTGHAKKRLTVFSFITLIILAAGAVYFFTQKKQVPQIPAISSLITENGKRTSIFLPDGSQVWLNAGSSLDYKNAEFNKELREVTLDGEAYFDVTKDPDRPFIIHTKRMDIKVIGTAFNVRSYDDEKIAEASLIRGSIEVTFKDRKAKPYILRPNEKVSIAYDDEEQPQSKPAKTTEANHSNQSIPEIIIKDLAPNPVSNIIGEIAWTQNKLYFENESLENIARIMERWYGKKIVIQNESLKKLRYTWRNLDNMTMENVLSYLKLSQPFNFRIENDTVLIY